MSRIRKRLIAWTAPLLFGGMVAIACHDSVPDHQLEQAQPELPIIVMSAYAPEWRRFLSVADVTDTTIDGSTYKIGWLAGEPVILMLTGIGIDRAEESTQDAIEHFDVQGIVFSGIAGGIHPDLRIGDVAVPARWARHDAESGDSTVHWYEADADMLGVARLITSSVTLERCTAAGECLDGDRTVVVGGNGTSGLTFISDNRERQRLWEHFRADVVDMETAVVARIAHEQGVPFIAIRSLSDLAGGSSRSEIRIYRQLAADNAAVTTEAFLREWGGVPVNPSR